MKPHFMPVPIIANETTRIPLTKDIRQLLINSDGKINIKLLSKQGKIMEVNLQSDIPFYFPISDTKDFDFEGTTLVIENDEYVETKRFIIDAQEINLNLTFFMFDNLEENTKELKIEKTKEVKNETKTQGDFE